MVDSATILTSASVAGFVSLAIEYAAKPRLEARKERVVAEKRLQREVTDLLHLAHTNVGMIQDFRDANEHAETSLDAAAVLLEDLPRLRRELEDQAFTLVQKGRLLIDTQGHEFYEVLTITAGTLRTVAMPSPPGAAFDQIDEAAGLSLLLLNRRWWRPKDRNLIGEARAWLDDQRLRRRPGDDSVRS